MKAGQHAKFLVVLLYLVGWTGIVSAQNPPKGPLSGKTHPTLRSDTGRAATDLDENNGES